MNKIPNTLIFSRSRIMILIGEKLNGFIPSVGAAIRAHDEAFLRDLAVRQKEAGADYLDVCAAVDSDSEAATLGWLAELAEEASGLPLCIDSPNPAVLTEVLPRCKRAGIVNSVSMESGKIEALFPLIADTNWKAVCLLSSNSGVPASVEGRMELFEQLRSKAHSFGITEDRLFIDPVVHTLSTDENSLSIFSACVREIRTRSTSAHVVSGLSNISFGLPARPLINRAFLVLAMQAGMDAAILDVLDREMTGLMYASDALLGIDEYCSDYIAAFRDNRFGPKKD
jgi:5-methyltetrahydrofolate--homocysteine methyltransferase